MSNHTQALIQACNNLDLPFEFVGNSDTFFAININGKIQYFIANRTPLNTQMLKRIVDDKKYTYDLLQDVISCPSTIGYIDPNAGRVYRPYVNFESVSQIATDIQQKLNLPVVIKPNQGSHGKKISICNTVEEIQEQASNIFRRSRRYSHVLIAQNKIDIAHEYRVTVLDKKIILVYEKDFSKAKFEQNLSPFHAKGTKAVVQTDPELLARIQTFIDPIFDKLDLEYGGLDIAIDNQNKMWLIEVNANPGYNFLVRDNGRQVLIEVFQKILLYLKNK